MKCIGGTHTRVSEETRLHVNHCTISEGFFACKLMSVDCKPRCCCGRKCKNLNNPHSLKEQRELSLIKSGLTLKNKVWEAEYPWIRNPAEFPDNYGVALAMLKLLPQRSDSSKRQKLQCYTRSK